MKTITIPAGHDPLTVIINGKTYTYRAGWEYSVPDAVAAVLANAAALAPQEQPAGGGGEGGALPPVTEDDDGKVLSVVDGAWAAAEAPAGGGDVLRIPFTLTVDASTGAITGTTDVHLADALAAKAAGKVVIADAVLVFSEVMTQYFCAVMSGHTGSGAALTCVAEVLSGSGDHLELYVIAWTGDGADGVQVIGKRVAVTDT